MIAPGRGDAVVDRQRVFEWPATSFTEKSLCTKDQIRPPNANASITNCPATAGATADIQRALPFQAPAMPKNACARCQQQREDHGELSDLGQHSGPLAEARLALLQRSLYRRRHVVLIVLGHHLVGDEHAAGVEAPVRNHAGVLLEQVRQHARVADRQLDA